MTTISLSSTDAVAGRDAAASLKSIVRFCAFGLLVSASMIMLGLDLGAVWA
jgi:hypothetical protein